LHKYGALSFWDYATAAPYVVVDMNPKPVGDDSGLCRKDAIFFSMHKVKRRLKGLFT
jgi:selenocysteine lyase/cysteine desulfurase